MTDVQTEAAKAADERISEEIAYKLRNWIHDRLKKGRGWEIDKADLMPFLQHAIDTVTAELREENERLKQQLAEVTADNAKLLSTLKCHWIEICDVWDVCRFCEATVTYKYGILKFQPQCSHKPNCILAAEHPGSRLLERLEAADDNNRRLTWALANYDKAKEPKP